MKVSVVVATYEWPDALDVVLRALFEQESTPSEVLIADDGSGEATAAIVERWRSRLLLEHVWQPHDGFRKARLLNHAVLKAHGDYLVFLDGDCLPRHGFVEAFRRSATPGWFAASKRLHLSPTLSKRVLEHTLPVWRWSVLHWLAAAPRELVTSHHRQKNRPGVLLPIRDRRHRAGPGGQDFTPPYNGYGYAFGVSREDVERANGFDMRFGGWDGEDVDIAIRLRAAGLRCLWPGPQASVLHLWHTPRKVPASPPSRDAGAIEAVVGLRELRAELAQASANRVGASSASSEPEKR